MEYREKRYAKPHAQKIFDFVQAAGFLHIPKHTLSVFIRRQEIMDEGIFCLKFKTQHYTTIFFTRKELRRIARKKLIGPYESSKAKRVYPWWYHSLDTISTALNITLEASYSWNGKRHAYMPNRRLYLNGIPVTVFTNLSPQYAYKISSQSPHALFITRKGIPENEYLLAVTHTPRYFFPIPGPLVPSTAILVYPDRLVWNHHNTEKTVSKTRYEKYRNKFDPFLKN
ncbi:MAG: hypothetical protein G01um101466_370 [Parcubacteria group bacterium Gr01-1014_66]|nr:MAG: hypothetical protein G01um101466_370 [Parcubacteria group bacterium Gr01-1014_66]